MNNMQADVAAMMAYYKQNTPVLLTKPSVKELTLRLRLIEEECDECTDALAALQKETVHEFANAFKEDDGVEREGEDLYSQKLRDFIKESCDVLVVILGTFVSMGINVEPFWEEVLRSNLSKTPPDSDTGEKILKGKNYIPPRILDILEEKSNNPVSMWWSNAPEEISMSRNAVRAGYMSAAFDEMGIPHTPIQ